MKIYMSSSNTSAIQIQIDFHINNQEEKETTNRLKKELCFDAFYTTDLYEQETK